VPEHEAPHQYAATLFHSHNYSTKQPIPHTTLKSQGKLGNVPASQAIHILPTRQHYNGQSRPRQPQTVDISPPDPAAAACCGTSKPVWHRLPQTTRPVPDLWHPQRLPVLVNDGVL
jgi:hypothetical protein